MNKEIHSNFDYQRERERYLKRFVDFRENYLDDLPDYELMPYHENYHKYKCRMAFFVAVRNAIDFLIRESFITNKNIVKEGNNFVLYTKEMGEKPYPGFTTREEIDMVNYILDLFIEELKKS